MANFFQILAASCATALMMIFVKNNINKLLMNLFRDVSRFKSRKRLYGKEAALIPILLGYEKPIKSKIDELENVHTMTVAELAEMDGQTEDTPIYVAVKGHIYDVSSARKMYGPGGKYHALAGRDATKAFATACFQPKCLAAPLTKLTSAQKKEIDKWDELYSQHDKYTFIGKLVNTDIVDNLVLQGINELEELDVSHDKESLNNDNDNDTTHDHAHNHIQSTHDEVVEEKSIEHEHDHEKDLNHTSSMNTTIISHVHESSAHTTIEEKHSEQSMNNNIDISDVDTDITYDESVMSITTPEDDVNGVDNSAYTTLPESLTETETDIDIETLVVDINHSISVNDASLKDLNSNVIHQDSIVTIDVNHNTLVSETNINESMQENNIENTTISQLQSEDTASTTTIIDQSNFISTESETITDITAIHSHNEDIDVTNTENNSHEVGNDTISPEVKSVHVEENKIGIISDPVERMEDTIIETQSFSIDQAHENEGNANIAVTDTVDNTLSSSNIETIVDKSVVTIVSHTEDQEETIIHTPSILTSTHINTDTNLPTSINEENTNIVVEEGEINESILEDGSIDNISLGVDDSLTPSEERTILQFLSPIELDYQNTDTKPILITRQKNRRYSNPLDVTVDPMDPLRNPLDTESITLKESDLNDDNRLMNTINAFDKDVTTKTFEIPKNINPIML